VSDSAPATTADPAESTELSQLAERIAGRAAAGEEVEAYVTRSRETEVRVYDGDVESVSSAESTGVGIRVVIGGRQGFAYAGSLDDDVVGETLAEARDNAGFATPDEWVGLARPDGVPAAHMDLWRDELAAFPAGDKVSMAVELEKAVRAGDRRIRQVESSEWGDAAIESAVATSTGISSSNRRTVCYLSVSAVAGDGSETQTAYGFSVGRAPSELDMDKAAGDAVERATRLLGASKPHSARLAVVLEPRITATLLALLGGTLDGESVLKGRSLFADRLGEAVSVPSFTLVDDPTDPAAYGATAYDAEGLACRQNVLIDGGHLQMYLYNTYAARRAGRASTASAVRAGYKSAPGIGARALTLSPGDSGPEQILGQVGTGLLVQSVSGVHSGVNPVSGDFSVGAEGVMIRDGGLAEPVREFTIASTIQRMLQNVVAVGNDQEWLPGSAVGVTLAIDDVSLSGAS
jgi:PmbA protein